MGQSKNQYSEQIIDAKSYLITKLILSKSKYIVMGAVLTFISIGLNLMFPWIMKLIVDQAIPQQDWNLLLFSIVGLILLPIFATIFDSLGSLFNHDQSNWIEMYRKVRNKTFVVDSDLILQGQRSIGLGIIFAYGAFLIFKDALSIGSLIAFTVYFPQLFGTLEKIQFAYLKSIETQPKIGLIYDLLSLDERAESTSLQSLSDVRGEIEFKNVSFSYQEDRGKVQNVSFQIQAGEFIGIVGASGGGKSTILDLIMRYYDPDQGQILLDGVDIKKINVHDLREKIGMVSQDIFMWNRSIKENLLYAKPNATSDEMLEACKRAQILDFILELPDSFDTIIGERGVKVSGGEKQRLAIARALLRKPQILLLDEPTSALDASTESLLQEQLEELFQEKTVIMVAHRLATVRNTDRMMVVKDGTIVEIGTHDELMRKKSVYYQLYTEQFQYG